jgi:hypothetical protein
MFLSDLVLCEEIWQSLAEAVIISKDRSLQADLLENDWRLAKPEKLER